jgi:hypothetical protein
MENWSRKGEDWAGDSLQFSNLTAIIMPEYLLDRPIKAESRGGRD